jgi:hypothetical protein
MSLRFQLVSRSGAAQPFSAVRGGDLGRWISPANATLGQLSGDVWKLDKQVIDLAAPETYRFRVTFRWTGAGGREIGQMVRQTSTCYQPELRPDLLVQSILVQKDATDPTQNRYLAEIRNNGATNAGPFEVEFTDGTLVTFRTVQLLKSQQSRTLEFVGPACNPQAPPTVTVDPANQVDDFNLTNNSLSAVCPAAGVTGSVRRGIHRHQRSANRR